MWAVMLTSGHTAHLRPTSLSVSLYRSAPTWQVPAADRAPAVVGSGLASRPTPGSQTADREDSDARDADGATGLPLVRSEAAVLTFSPPSSACLALPGRPPRMLADGATEAADGTADAAEPDGNRAADDSGPLCGGLRGWTRQAPGPTIEGHIVLGALPPAPRPAVPGALLRPERWQLPVVLLRPELWRLPVRPRGPCVPIRQRLPQGRPRAPGERSHSLH